MTIKIGDILIGENSGMVVLAQDTDLIACTLDEARQIGNVLTRIAEEQRKVIDGIIGEKHDYDRRS